ncbi:hypothetical protein EJ08DRAFT_680087 [Tothia fuscella]|uniref:Ferritin-like domain-containing protein n=1 Tax=Tothia fuscella TaxID=1048955 RepID=A0A9P4NPL8_9PEZI|nr:hypothetical protein EJ08DRAFT_680087 [Tothia fuscella]
MLRDFGRNGSWTSGKILDHTNATIKGNHLGSPLRLLFSHSSSSRSLLTSILYQSFIFHSYSHSFQLLLRESKIDEHESSHSIIAALATVASGFAIPSFPFLSRREVYTDEDKFYREGLANFSQQAFQDAVYGATFYQNLQEISRDETTHVNFLTGALQALGKPAVKECTYAFNIPNVQTFLATASILEGVGVSAYLGAAGLITSKAYLTAAGSILTSESRHNAYLRSVLRLRPYPQPFDVPITFNEVYTMAYGFFTSFPADNPTFLPVKAFPTLLATSTGPIKTGSTVTLSTSKVNGMAYKIDGTPLYAAWISAAGPIFVPAVPKGDMLSWDVTVPAGIHGQSYVILTGCNDKLTDDTVTAGPTIVEVQGRDGAPNLLP